MAHDESGQHVPWTVPTRQEQGRTTERRLLAERGARRHPMSGAGSIKQDGSTDTEVFEIKDANRTFMLSGAELLVGYLGAVRQGKDSVWIIKFTNGIKATINVTRETQ